jgi:hypothetical protein
MASSNYKPCSGFNLSFHLLTAKPHVACGPPVVYFFVLVHYKLKLFQNQDDGVIDSSNRSIVDMTDSQRHKIQVKVEYFLSLISLMPMVIVSTSHDNCQNLPFPCFWVIVAHRTNAQHLYLCDVSSIHCPHVPSWIWQTT